MDFPVVLERDTNDTVLVSFPDLPWVHTFGKDEADALARASEALDTAIEFLIRERRSIPAPSAVRRASVGVSALVAAKIALHNEMVAQGVSKAELKRRLDVHGPQVDRLVDARHASRVDQLEAAFSALGKRLELSVAPARIWTPTHRAKRATSNVGPRKPAIRAGSRKA